MMEASKMQLKKTSMLLLAAVVLFIMSYFTIYESTHIIHECTGEDCPICHELNMAESFTKQVTYVPLIGVLCFLLVVWIGKIKTAVSGSVSERNLVIDKVRIDN